jgi:predicted SprT family Zn-dependent metalloprotease
MTAKPNDIYHRLVQAYDWFNQHLFEDRLPPVVLTLRGKQAHYGYFLQGEFQATEDLLPLDEIALNATHFDRTALEVLSTLAHEMTHLEQLHFGRPSAGGYHNKAWVVLMERIGLRPYNVKDPDKVQQTGTTIHHDIVAGGRFEQAANELLATGWQLNIVETTPTPKPNTRTTQKRKTKYECECGAKVWGRPGLTISCGDCLTDFMECSND